MTINIINKRIEVGSTLTAAPFVVKDEVVVGASGAELGALVRAYSFSEGPPPVATASLSAPFHSAVAQEEMASAAL